MYARTDDIVEAVAQFLASGAAATGLTVTAKVWELRPDGSKVPNDTTGTTATVSEVGGGVYRVHHTMAGDGVPLFVFHTAGTADQSDIATSALTIADLALQTSVDALEGRLTATRAEYLDNLSGGAVALEATVAALNDFDPATDVVAHVTLVDTTTTNSDMVDVSSLALEATLESIKAKTDELTFTEANKVDATATFSTSGLATEATVRSILEDTGTTIPATLAAITTTVGNILKWFTNKRTVTASQQVLYDDDGTTPLYTQVLSDDDTTAQRNAAT